MKLVRTFLNFFSEDTLLWLKDVDLTLDVIQKYYEKSRRKLSTHPGTKWNTR